MTAYFSDFFATHDPTRWFDLAPGASQWPPNPATPPGKWCRTLQQGWPTHTGSQDPAARFEPSNGEMQCYENSGVTLFPGGLGLVGSTTPGCHFPQQPYTSGVIAQNRFYGLAGGYFEADMLLPNVAGTWPGFWIMPCNGSWDFEIDQIEFPHVDASGATTSTTYHFGANNAGNTTSAESWVTGISDLTTRRHKFGLLWLPGATIGAFLDRVQVAELPCPALATTPGYMILSQAIGGRWPGPPAASFDGCFTGIRSVQSWKLGTWGSGQLPPEAPQH